MRVLNSTVRGHETLIGDHRLLVLECPEMAMKSHPGQFVHMQIPGADALTLRRPFSIYKANNSAIHILYREIGKGTRAMAKITAGDTVSLIGPLGNGFPTDHADTYPILVAGGYGIAPLFFLASKLPQRGIVMVGARTAKDIVCERDFAAAGWEMRTATDDGTKGRHGLVTGILKDWLKNERGDRTPEFYSCGPDGMQKAVRDIALEHDLKAWLSMERHMGCGVGACLACVQEVMGDDGKMHRLRVCKEGPIFEARQLVWENC